MAALLASLPHGPRAARERVRPAPPQVRGQRDGQTQPHAHKADLNQRGLPDRHRRACVPPALRIAIRRAQQRTENGVRQHRDEEPRPNPSAENQRRSRYAHPPRPHQRERHRDPDPCHTDRGAVEHHPLRHAEPGPDRQQPQERPDHPRHLDQQVGRQRQRCPIRRHPPDPIPPIHLNSQLEQRSSSLIHHCLHGRQPPGASISSLRGSEHQPTGAHRTAGARGAAGSSPPAARRSAQTHRWN